MDPVILQEYWPTWRSGKQFPNLLSYVHQLLSYTGVALKNEAEIKRLRKKRKLWHT